MTSDFQHPCRFERNVDGPFYTTGEAGGSDCLVCAAPESEAPDLLADVSGENSDSYFTRQPESAAEIEAACRAMLVCCVAAFRYGGTDVEVIRRLGNSPRYCDFVETEEGSLVCTVGANGQPLEGFASSINAAATALVNEFTAVHDGQRVRWFDAWHPRGADLEAIRAQQRDEYETMLQPVRGVRGVALRGIARVRRWTRSGAKRPPES